MREGYEMTDDLKKLLAEFYGSRTMIGTSYTLTHYVENKISIEATLIVQKDYVRAEVKEEVEEFIKDYFSYENFTFEDEIVKSELEEDIKNSIDGVKSFRITTPTMDVIASEQPYQIFALGGLTVTASGGE